MTDHKSSILVNLLEKAEKIEEKAKRSTNTKLNSSF